MSSEFNTTKNLNVDVATQNFTSGATIEKYNYRLEDSDYANIAFTRQKTSTELIKSQVTQMCLNKLNKSGEFEINPDNLRNCQRKAILNYSLYY